MPNQISQSKDLLDVLVQMLIIVVPVVLSWFIRTFIKNSATESRLAAVVRLSNAAIDYVENMDKRGDLKLPPDVKKGGLSFKLAAEWLESELKRNDIKMDTPQAEKWISAEFQKRVGTIIPNSSLAELARLAVDLLQNLERNKFSELPADADRMSYLAGLGADWVIAQLAQTRGAILTHAEALPWVRAEILQRLQLKQLPSGDKLMDLARDAVTFVTSLKASGQLTLRPGASGGDVERDVVIAWMLTEAAKQRMSVSPDEIAQAVVIALRQRANK